MKLFRKPKSKFCWYDFTVRRRRHRGSTHEPRAVNASKVAGLQLARILEGTDTLPNKPTAVNEFAQRFLAWVNDARLEVQTKTYYRNGWRMLRATAVVNMRLDEITDDSVERLKFLGSSANANCASRTLRRMLHKAEEWKLVSCAPKIKLMKEHGRSLRPDDAGNKVADCSCWLQMAKANKRSLS